MGTPPSPIKPRLCHLGALITNQGIVHATTNNNTTISNTVCERPTNIALYGQQKQKQKKQKTWSRSRTQDAWKSSKNGDGNATVLKATKKNAPLRFGLKQC